MGDVFVGCHTTYAFTQAVLAKSHSDTIRMFTAPQSYVAGDACQQPLVEQHNTPVFGDPLTLILSPDLSTALAHMSLSPIIKDFSSPFSINLPVLDKYCSQPNNPPFSLIDGTTFHQKLPDCHGNHLKDTMNSDRDSNFELINSSVCHACRSLGDMSSPRGALVDAPEGRRQLGRYHYIYMHHPSVAALVRSAKGCSICNVLRNTLRRLNKPQFDKAAATVTPALTTASTSATSIADAEQSDDEVATRLAEQVKLKTSLKRLDLGDIGKGRIIIQHSSHNKLGPRGNTDIFNIRAYVLDAWSLSVYLSVFQTSCRSYPA